MNVLVLGNLVALNDGYTTYSRPGSRPSILDFKITTTDMPFTWTLEQGSWGSDHIPIQLRGRHSRLKSKRSRSIIMSNKFRSSMELSKLLTLRSNLLSVMQKAMRTIMLPASMTVSDVKSTNLRAVHGAGSSTLKGVKNWITRRLDYVKTRIDSVPLSY